MEKILQLEKGQIVLNEQRIIISDKAKREKIHRLASSSMWSLYGVLSVLRYNKTGDEFLLWTGLLIGVSHFTLLILGLFISSKSEIELLEIKTAKFKERFGNKFLDLHLKNGLKRRIRKIDTISDELQEFFSDRNIRTT